VSGVACVIPAFDAAATLERVVRGLRASLPQALLIAVDDGSADATHDVAATCCDRCAQASTSRMRSARTP
jgi:glycosyltransferase involved in cell wall biosynthesis